ncbi:MAG TPA: uridine diphosphate-N-acetylglucosamine-binding protein YvcK [Acidimicrobiia bacterium]|nr:uridine diphosphate-N-acetylglucosamine-binding protein YvcK [Acidimicrobiia bacterium]
MSDRPRVVALGGGHGLAVVLRAAREYAGDITAVVSVADDGGSSGRLRRDLDVYPPGDLRKCLVALAGPGNPWAGAFEHRFTAGELDGHALGNLILVGLAETLDDPVAAIDEAARLLGAVGRVRPATAEPVVLKADIEGSSVQGQVAVMTDEGRIRRVELVPRDAAAHPDAVAAIAAADQVVLAPGSLYTSLLSVLVVPELRAAVAAAPGRVVQVCNLRPQPPETTGLDAADHLRAVLDHRGRVDTFLYEQGGALPVDDDQIRAWDVEPVAAGLAGRSGLVHDPARLAQALADLLQSEQPGGYT